MRSSTGAGSAPATPATCADGYLYIHDRVKDMIVSGGENIYPAEIENALMSHPEVADVAVIGVPSDKWGETVKAIVVLAGASDIGDRDLIGYCRERLAHYKCPTSVDFTETIPRNPSGKILKTELRKPFWRARTASCSRRQPSEARASRKGVKLSGP